MLACKEERGGFLSDADLRDINACEHHKPNALFCLFLARLLLQLRAEQWKNVPTSIDHSAQEQQDIALFQTLLSKFREVRAELNRKFLGEDWSDDKLRLKISMHMRSTVAVVIDQIIGALL